MHLYGIDCGNGALLPLTELPHCGAVVSRAQTERATRLLRRLAAELSRRQELLAAAGFADIREQRAAFRRGERLPHVFVLLTGGRDSPARWENSRRQPDGILTRLLSEGASVGMHLVMTGDRSLLVGRISALCEEKLVFKLAEKEDYRLAGLNPRNLPDDLPPGRAFRSGIGTSCRWHCSRLTHPGKGRPPRCSPSRRTAGPAMRRFRQRSGRSGWTRCRRTCHSPTRGNCGRSPPDPCGAWSGSAATHSSGRAGPRLRDALLHRGRPRQIRTVHHPAVHGEVVPGGRNTGRAGRAAAIPAARARGVPGVLGLFDRPELGEAELAEALASFRRPGVVLIDDAELLRDCGAASELSRLVTRGGDAGRALVLGGDAESIGVGFSGWQVEAKRARRGCLTAPATIPEGDLIGVRLPRDVLGQPPRPGRCLLHTGDGKLITVSVPAA